MLSGNQEKAIATLKRIATENGAPMPLGKLIISRQVSARRTDCEYCRTSWGACVRERVGVQWAGPAREFGNFNLCIFIPKSYKCHLEPLSSD